MSLLFFKTHDIHSDTYQDYYKLKKRRWGRVAEPVGTKTFYVMAYDGEEPAAGVMLEDRGDHLYLHYLTSRIKGSGALLIKHVVENYKKTIKLHALDSKKIIKYYAKLGFKTDYGAVVGSDPDEVNETEPDYQERWMVLRAERKESTLTFSTSYEMDSEVFKDYADIKGDGWGGIAIDVYQKSYYYVVAYDGKTAVAGAMLEDRGDHTYLEYITSRQKRAGEDLISHIRGFGKPIKLHALEIPGLIKYYHKIGFVVDRTAKLKNKKDRQERWLVLK